MDRYMDIDDLGANSYFSAEDMEYNDFTGKAYKEYREEIKRLEKLPENKGKSKKEIKQIAKANTGYGGLIKDVITQISDKQKDDGSSEDPAIETPSSGDGGNGGNGGGGGNSGGGGGGGLNIAGMTIPTPALIGLGVVAAYFAYKKLA